MELYRFFWSRGFFIIYWLILLKGKASAQDGSRSGGIDGATIGIAVGVSIITSLITTLVTISVVHCISKNKKKSTTLNRDAKERASTVSSRYSDASLKPLFKRSESQETSMSQQVNGDLRYRSGTKAAINNHNRFKTDYTAKWCTENALTEATAQCLRDCGFTTRAAVEALRVEDIHRLNLRSIAEECKIREVINRSLSLKKSESQSSVSGRHRSTSEECLPSSPGTMCPNDISAGSSVFERSSSMHQVDTVDGPLPIGKPLRAKRSMGSMEIIDDRLEAAYSINGSRGALPLHINAAASARNGTTFNGLLSDKGLWQLANMIGAEWPHLATLLKIPKFKQDQIQLDYPNNAMLQINEMLRLWRDTDSGSKEQIKGRLHDAFIKVKRNDLAEYLLQETINGSAEKVHTFHTII